MTKSYLPTIDQIITDFNGDASNALRWCEIEIRVNTEHGGDAYTNSDHCKHWTELHNNLLKNLINKKLKELRYLVTEENLSKLATFGKEEDGSYCDRWMFSIRKIGDRWSFNFFSEVDGSEYHIKYLRDMKDLKTVYKAISNNELLFKCEHDRGFAGGCDKCKDPSF